MNPIRILVADEQHLIRVGIRALLHGVGGRHVVGEARDGAEALRLAAELAPDLLIMDVAMPELSGMQVLQHLHSNGSPAKVVMLSMADDAGHAIQALALGASGYVSKKAAPGELEAAVDAVLRGEIWSPGALPRPAADLGTARPDRGAALTQRQEQVLKLIADGASSRVIAERLGISIKTVETHRAQIMVRLDIQDVPGLVRYAILRGISRL